MATYTQAQAQPQDKEPKGPIEDIYDKISNGEAGKWLCAITCLGLSAAVVAKSPSGAVKPAAASLIAIVCLLIPCAYK